ncbi:MAG: radical SAM protein, partial [Chloroflexi bacterium]|nr:radical SAM protein [Chloroflexota bacterium]
MFAMVSNPRPLAVKTALNRVANMPFRWSLNPYRGCAHACVYCYARVTHEYLGLDPGRGFETDVLAKVDVGDALARELGRPRWRGEEVAVGTATDPYQPAEARLRLTRRVLE